METNSPFQHYVESIASFYSAAADHRRFNDHADILLQELNGREQAFSKLMGSLRLELPNGSAHTSLLEDYDRDIQALNDYLTETQAWFDLVANGLKASASFIGLYNKDEWFLPMSRWGTTGAKYLCILQTSLSTRSLGTVGILNEINGHIAQHSKLLRAREAQARSEQEVADLLTAVMRLAEPQQTFPPLLGWRTRVWQQIDATQTSLGAHSPTIRDDGLRLQASRREYDSLIAEFLSIETKLNEALRTARQSVHLQREHLDTRTAWLASARQKTVNAVVLGLLIGILAFGFVGCAYGCVSTQVTAGGGLQNGGLLGALIGPLVGYLTAFDELQKAGQSVSGAKVALLNREDDVAQAMNQLNVHRALRPPALPAKS